MARGIDGVLADKLAAGTKPEQGWMEHRHESFPSTYLKTV
jgi:hypothetical protein